MALHPDSAEWSGVALTVAVIVLLLGSSFVAGGLVSAAARPTPGKPPAEAGSSNLGTELTSPHLPTINLPSGPTCTQHFLPPNLVTRFLFGPGCYFPQSNVNQANEAAGAQNIITTLDNYLNITNSEVANQNATFQELLSYYEARAEAIVPYFLNNTWNQSVYDAIAVDSGLVPSIEGVESAFSYQEYQDWNATAGSWDALFGSSGTYKSSTAAFALDGGVIAFNLYNINVSVPFEFWTAGPRSLFLPGIPGGNTTYFNMEPGGTIIDANWDNLTGAVYGNYTVYDITQGTQFTVPDVTYSQWVENKWPVESTIHNIHQFDLLKVVCSSRCVTAYNSTFETSGAYAFRNSSTVLPVGSNTLGSMIPLIQLSQTSTASPAGELTSMSVPRITSTTAPQYACIDLNPIPTFACSTSEAPVGGDSIQLGTGPGSVIGGNATLVSFASTAQHLINNTMVMAYDYWVTLRAITLNGTYSVPANCGIPTPSDAFPVATNYLNYNLSVNNVEAIYLAYLNAVAREYGEVFTSSVGFCGDANLGFSFNWTEDWALALNITASVYLYGTVNGTGTPVELNGTAAPNTTYANVASWPAYSVDPALLYPYEYQQDIPLNTRFPIPINNPMIGVLVNYAGNVGYGNAAFTPAWGVPTYVSLVGNGNYTNVSGQSTSIPSGNPVAKGDAIVVTACVLNGVPQNPCDVSVTYFNSFTIGLVHAILPPTPTPTPGGGGGASGFNGGICSSLFSWIPLIGSSVTALCNFILGVLEIVLIIVVLAVAIWAVSKLYGSRGRGGNNAGGKGKVTVNVS